MRCQSTPQGGSQEDQRPCRIAAPQIRLGPDKPAARRTEDRGHDIEHGRPGIKRRSPNVSYDRRQDRSDNKDVDSVDTNAEREEKRVDRASMAKQRCP